MLSDTTQQHGLDAIITLQESKERTGSTVLVGKHLTKEMRQAFSEGKSWVVIGNSFFGRVFYRRQADQQVTLANGEQTRWIDYKNMGNPPLRMLLGSILAGTVWTVGEAMRLANTNNQDMQALVGGAIFIIAGYNIYTSLRYVRQIWNRQAADDIAKVNITRANQHVAQKVI